MNQIALRTDQLFAAIDRALRHQGRRLLTDAELDDLPPELDALEFPRRTYAQALALHIAAAEALAEALGLSPIQEHLVVVDERMADAAD